MFGKEATAGATGAIMFGGMLGIAAAAAARARTQQLQQQLANAEAEASAAKAQIKLLEQQLAEANAVVVKPAKKTAVKVDAPAIHRRMSVTSAAAGEERLTPSEVDSAPPSMSVQHKAAATLQRALRRQSSSQQLNGNWSMRKWLRSLNLHIIVAEALVPPQGVDHFKWVTSRMQEHVEACLLAKDLGGLSRFVWASIEPLRQQGGAATFEGVASSKFAGCTELDYGGLDVFFGGLEGKIGTPQPRVEEAMEAEHTRRSDSQVSFTTGNYGVTTTSEIEYASVVSPTAREAHGSWPRALADRGKGQVARPHVDAACAAACGL